MATPNYAPHYFFTGLGQGLLQAMERRLQREEEERRVQRQLELEQSRSQPVDILPFLPQEIRERAYPDRQEPLLIPSNVVPGLTSQLLSVYGRQPEQTADLPVEFLTDWLTAAQTGDTSALQPWAGTNVPVQALSGLGTFVSRVATTPSQIGLTEARTEETQAGAELTRVETRRKELETQLLEEFGRAERAAALEGFQLQNIARQIGIELDKEELEFLRETMGPRVAKAVAEAAAAEMDLQMSQETFELTVQRLQEELNNLRIENKISEQQYEQAVQMAPYLIQDAQLKLLQRQYENERLQLETEYARQSFEPRLRQLDLQSQQLQAEITRTTAQIEMLNQQIAMAKRTDPLRAQQLEADLELTRERLRQLQIENGRLEAQSSALRSLSTDDREFVRKLYEIDIAPFKGQRVWIPSYADYVDNLLSDQPLDWNQYVMLYDREMRSKIGPPPSDDPSYEWLKSEWQSAYRSAKDAYYDRFPDFERAYSHIPEYPPIQVWYAWVTSPDISQLDPLSEEFRNEHNRLVAWWNGQLDIEGLEQAVQRAISSFGSAATALEELESASPDLRTQIEQLYGVSVDEIIEELRKRAEGSQESWLNRFFQLFRRND